MITYQAINLAEIINAEFYSKSDDINNISINEIVFDTRLPINNPTTAIFFALKGIQDGHLFIDEAYKKGIRNFCISNKSFINKFLDANFFIVDDTLVALQNWAKYHRQKFNIPIVGITGSNGKTIVKEWLSTTLSSKYVVAKNPRSYNSQIGLPYSVLQIEPKHQIGIFEVGISQPLEMGKLAPILQPDTVIFTNIGPAHQQYFKNIDEKINEKLKLAENAKKFIISSEYTNVLNFVNKLPLQIIKWGYRDDDDIKITKKNANKWITEIEINYKNKTLNFSLPFIDTASIENAMNVISCSLDLGLSQDEIQSSIYQWETISMRLESVHGINGNIIINDFYSNDILSLSISLQYMSQKYSNKKKIVFLSDILESSENVEVLYKKIADELTKNNVNEVYTIGDNIKKLSEYFPLVQGHFTNTEECIMMIEPDQWSDSVILLKGARKFTFEKLLPFLVENNSYAEFKVSLNAIQHNYQYFRSIISPNTGIIAMVKAFAYGSGAEDISSFLEQLGVDYLGVAFSHEGLALRKANINSPIMVMSPHLSSLEMCIKYNLEPEIYSFQALEQMIQVINEYSFLAKLPFPIHIKLDTGMHRLGFMPEDYDKLSNRLKQVSKLIKVSTVFSHFSASDMPEHDDFTRLQAKRLFDFTAKLENDLSYKIKKHICNTHGVIRFPEYHCDYVRIGLGLYGITSIDEVNKKLMPAVELTTFVSQIRNIDANESVGYNRKGLADHKRVIATIPMGYADGIFREMGNGNGYVKINNKFAPIVGDICMDMMMADVTHIWPNISEGDEVLIFGEDISILDYAKTNNTIPYQVMTSISPRVKRSYIYFF
ncbi:MAG TPA: bifunctional UDP-N-acetylmuramoyl-tripeptide:D-alanyl-D-alanine ligase/alanine racemase [Bacteroidales bacterium]|nr:bifunctional UDP-N-acetylmuramoyl-tripeptide:D-alanyl-D-alanine ligase/alanine racemase [Bacteroidales bacterium]